MPLTASTRVPAPPGPGSGSSRRPSHSDVSTTMIYTHVLKLGGGAVRSPLDALQAA